MQTLENMSRPGLHPEGPCKDEDTKGARRMPWHRKSTKDAASCDKLGGGANTRYHPEVSEWGNPAGPIPCYLPPESIGRQGTTRGTETSKYPEEEKSTEIARVAASESAPAQTHARVSGEALPHGGRGTAHLQARALQAQSQRHMQPNRHGKAGRSG